MNTISIVTFILATGSVALFTYRIVIGMKKSDKPIPIYKNGHGIRELIEQLQRQARELKEEK